MKIAQFPVFALLRLFLTRYLSNENLVNEKRIKVVKELCKGESRNQFSSAFVMSKNTALNLHRKLRLL